MRLLLICRGASAEAAPRAADSAGFDELCRKETEGEIAPAAGKPPALLGRPVYAAPGLSARQTAEQLFPGAEIRIEPLLEEIPCRSYKDTSRRLPLWFWRFMAWLQRLLGLARQGETRRETAARADALLDRLAAEGGEAILIVPPRLLPVLLDRLRRRNCCAQRSGVLRYRPFERILVSEREEHCGGCQHNCLLSDPGCGVGRDKAARRKLEKEKL